MTATRRKPDLAPVPPGPRSRRLNVSSAPATFFAPLFACHPNLDEKHYYDSRRYDASTNLQAPLRIDQFIEGGSLNFLARFQRHTVLAMGSMNFIEREFQGLEPDVLLAGINGSRLGLYDYDRRLLTSTGFPPVVAPAHWDNFRYPYGFSQEENFRQNVVPSSRPPGSSPLRPW